MKRMALLITLFLYGQALPAQEAPKGVIALDGAAAPSLRLPDLDGRVTDLDALRGQWVMVHFWAGWCTPCRRELPALERMRERLPQGPRLVMVNTAETDDEVFLFLTGVAPGLTSLLDRDGQTTERWQPRGLPSTFLVDPQGRLRHVAVGDRPWDSEPYIRFLSSLKKP